jgi:hypothetical protein
MYKEIADYNYNGLSEGVVDKINNILSKMSKSDQNNINKVILELIAKHFNSPFDKYLVKYLRKNVVKNLSIYAYLKRLKESNFNDKQALDTLFLILANPALDYIKDKLKPAFFRSPITGNKIVDHIAYNTISHVFKFETQSREFRAINAYLKANLIKFFKDVAQDVVNDEEFPEEPLEESNNYYSEEEFINEFNLLAPSIKKQKWQVFNTLVNYIPHLNKQIRREIRNDIFSGDTDIKGILNARRSDTKIRYLTEIAYEPILEYVINHIDKKIIPQDEFAFIGDMLQKILIVDNKNNFKKYFRENLKAYITQIHYQKKEQAKKNKKKNRYMK